MISELIASVSVREMVAKKKKEGINRAACLLLNIDIYFQ